MGVDLHIVYNPSYARHVNTVDVYLLVGRWRSLHHLRQCRCHRHFVGKVHMTFLQELLHLRTGGVHAGQDGEYRFLTLQYLLVQHRVSIIQTHQTGRPEDDHDGIDVVEVLLTIVDGDTQMFGRTRCQHINGVTDGSTRQQLRLQFLCSLTAQKGYLHASFRQGIGQHHTRTTGMGDDGEVLTRELR